MSRIRIGLMIVLLGFSVQAMAQGDVLGQHNLTPSLISGGPGGRGACEYCHVPHSGTGKGPLWGQKFSSVQNYGLYANNSSSTMANMDLQPIVGGPSSLCLSCHDGTVAPGDTVPYGSLGMPALSGSSSLGIDLKGTHPFSLKLPLVDSADLVANLFNNGITADPDKKVQLVGGNVECESCHNPHAQAIDKISTNFLVKDGSSSAICLACHEVNPRTVGTKSNPLDQWTNSVHALSGSIPTTANLGSYAEVGTNGCLSCHMPHNSLSDARLLRAPVPAVANMDAATQSCVNCHDGGSEISPPLRNLMAEFAKKTQHPFPTGTNLHDPNEPAVLNNNRHATCVDCHNPHAAQQEGSFTPPPNIRSAQNGEIGVSATDGTTVLTPAVNQYETCLRCHGSSTNKPASSAYGYLPNYLDQVSGDPFDVRRQMDSAAVSSHPVMHARTGNTEPSLRPYMLDFSGSATSRSMAAGTYIFCTDCHNSDDNREFGGTGPEGPHGSAFDHILERRYEFSQVSTGGPGSTIENLFVNPSTSPNCSGGSCDSPYSLCAKCHDLDNVLSDASFPYHSEHVGTDGFSCSVCHTAHGDPTGAGTGGQRLVNFDLNVVASNGGAAITYDPGTQTCVLVCHGHAHS